MSADPVDPHLSIFYRPTSAWQLIRHIGGDLEWPRGSLRAGDRVDILETRQGGRELGRSLRFYVLDNVEGGNHDRVRLTRASQPAPEKVCSWPKERPEARETDRLPASLREPVLRIIHALIDATAFSVTYSTACSPDGSAPVERATCDLCRAQAYRSNRSFALDALDHSIACPLGIAKAEIWKVMEGEEERIAEEGDDDAPVQPADPARSLNVAHGQRFMQLRAKLKSATYAPPELWHGILEEMRAVVDCGLADREKETFTKLSEAWDKMILAFRELGCGEDEDPVLWLRKRLAQLDGPIPDHDRELAQREGET